MNDEYQSNVTDRIDRPPPPLTGVTLVFFGFTMVICENVNCLFERDTMLTEIARRFVWVPFEPLLDSQAYPPIISLNAVFVSSFRSPKCICASR